MTQNPWLAAAGGALLTLCLAALFAKRRDLWALARAQPLISGAAVTLAVVAVWLAYVAGRRQPPPPPAGPVPDRDLTPTPNARPPRPAQVDHAHDLPLDTLPDPAAPLVVAPEPELGDLVLRLDERARQRADTPAE